MCVWVCVEGAVTRLWVCVGVWVEGEAARLCVCGCVWRGRLHDCGWEGGLSLFFYLAF